MDPYRVLNVPRTAERHTIRAAYRALAWQWHPDRGGSQDQMIQINEAWRILGHASRRAAYNAATLAVNPARTWAPADAPVKPDASQGPSRHASGPGVIDYGRYAGWSIERLAEHDPNFLEWLLRMPAGRQYAAQIREVLDQREREQADLAPASPARKSRFGFKHASKPG
jgi:curved DNA-binding protein CbpA